MSFFVLASFAIFVFFMLSGFSRSVWGVSVCGRKGNHSLASLYLGRGEIAVIRGNLGLSAGCERRGRRDKKEDGPEWPIFFYGMCAERRALPCEHGPVVHHFVYFLLHLGDEVRVLDVA